MTGQAAEEDNAGQSRHCGVTQQAVKQGSLSNMISLFQNKSKQGCPVCQTFMHTSAREQVYSVSTGNKWKYLSDVHLSRQACCLPRKQMLGFGNWTDPWAPSRLSWKFQLFLSSRLLKAPPVAFSFSKFMLLWCSAESYRWDPLLLYFTLTATCNITESHYITS